MTIELSKRSIDVGLVAADLDRSLTFYRDLLGLDPVGTMPMPDGGTMHRLQCGDATLKVIEAAVSPDVAPGGPISSRTGWRYITIWVAAVGPVIERCRSAGCRIEVEPWEFRPGVTVGIVEDFEGNLVELVSIRRREAG